MKTIKLLVIVSFLSVLYSCTPQKKTVLLANGKYVTQKKYDKMISNAFKHAEKVARKTSKMSKKEMRDFEKSLSVKSSNEK